MTLSELEKLVEKKHLEHLLRVKASFNQKKVHLYPLICNKILEDIPSDLPCEVFTVSGSIPEWNDGDPCVYTQEVSYPDGDLERFVRNHGVQEDMKERWSKEVTDLVMRYYREVKPLEAYLKTLSDLLHKALDTNWAIRFQKQNGVWTYESINFDTLSCE